MLLKSPRVEADGEPRASGGVSGTCQTSVTMKSTSDSDISSIWPGWGSALTILVFLFIIAVFASMITVIIFQSRFYNSMRKALNREGK